MSTYFGGNPANMGVVHALPHNTFADLVENLLRVPVILAVTKAQLLAMDKVAAGKAKATDYLVPATFAGNPSPRRTEHALTCPLVFLDIDDADEAKRVLAAGPANLLGDLSAVVYHTARSTPAAPRLRVVVSAENVPAARYADAVNTVAAMMGLSAVTRESQVAVQPMFLPTCFSDDSSDPIIHCHTAGRPLVFDSAAISPLKPSGQGQPTGSADDDGMVVGGLENLRDTIDGIEPSDVVSALEAIDPDCAMQQWVEIGMGLKHQFGEDGWPLWRDWSAKAKSKYAGESKTRRRWDSFTANPTNRTPVTLRSVLRIAEEAGWDNTLAGESVYGKLADWIASSSRSTEELLDHGTNRIADAAPLVGSVKQAALVGTLARVIRARGIAGVSVSSLNKAVKERIEEVAKAQNPSGPPPWSNNIVFVTASNLFYRHVDNRKMRPDVVDLIYRSPEPDKPARQYLVHVANIKVVENLRYDPTTTDRFVVHGGVPYCNTYRVTYPNADYSQLDEVAEFFTAHADRLFGPTWSRHMIDYGAYMAQHPGKKIRWAPLVQSGVGAGKGLWAGFLTVALGQSNVQRLAAEHVLEATYNSWASGYQLTVMDEVYNVGHNSHRVMNKLKPSISDDFVSVRALYEPVQTVPNVMNFIMFTNHHNSLAVHDDDRRYFVLKSPLQSLSDISALGGDAYFQKGYDLLRTHAGGVRAFFESWGIAKDFPAEGRAPVTPFLKELAAATASPLAAAVQEVIDDQPHALVRRDLVSMHVLRAMLPPDRLPQFSDQGLSAVLREKGFVSVGRHDLEGVRHNLWARGLAGDPVQEAATRLSVL